MAGCHVCMLTVNEATVPRPLLASGATFRDRQREQPGVGGCSQKWQAWQRRNRSWPSAPPCQKCSFSLVTCGCERSEEHTSELQSLMRSSYAALCWTKKKHDMICPTEN